MKYGYGQMNCIEIDKILHNLYSVWDGRARETYYRLVEPQFKWDRTQAVVATEVPLTHKGHNYVDESTT